MKRAEKDNFVKEITIAFGLKRHWHVIDRDQ